MGGFTSIFKPVLAAVLLSAACGLPLAAQNADLESLMADLADPENEHWQVAERKVRAEWMKSGSAAMDLLLQRGEKAMEAGDFNVALEHFSALTDHAPEFAEGWNARATALYRLKLYGPAMQDIGRTLALNPRQFEAISGLAVILQDLGYPQDALAAWRLLQAIHPHMPHLKENIETLERETGGTRL